jgi:polysaccharide deacetylase 2 family uncharacterized protein YibQ
VAADDLDAPLEAPLGKPKSTTPKPRRFALSVTLPQAIAGLLGAAIVVAGVWTLVAKDPYGGEPVAIVATPGNGGNAANNAMAATATPAASAPQAAAHAAKPSDIAAHAPPGSKIITITDGSNGEVQQVVVAPPAAPAGQNASEKRAAADPQLLEKTAFGEIPKIAADGRRPSSAYAHPVKIPPEQASAPRIALIVGGLGIGASLTADAIDTLPAPVTLAFIPYGNGLDAVAADAGARGHELLLQAPMEPLDYPDNDPGPQTLLTSLSAAENAERLHAAMARMPGYVGVTSLMGARFLASDSALMPVFKELASRGLIYVDDGLTSRSVAAQAAGANNLPFARAAVALDAVATPGELPHMLAKLELAARESGSAVGYVTASSAAVSQIAAWTKAAAGRGFVLVPVSMAVSKPKSS